MQATPASQAGLAAAAGGRPPVSRPQTAPAITPAGRLRNPALERCLASEDVTAVTLDRRQLGGAVLAAGLSVCALAAPAHADGECVFIEAPSGLKFCDVREGDGATPAKGSMIRAHYTGRLAANNAKFDSSYDRGRPLSFKVGVGEVIKGWDVGIAGGDGVPPMREGGKRKLIIPAELAYGSRSVGGGLIPANSVLLFDVELLGKR